MLEPYPLTTGQDPISGEYQQVLHWTVTGKPARAIWLQVLALPVFLLLGFVFAILAIKIGSLPDTIRFGLLEIGLCLAGIVVTIVLHELVHGLAMRRFGARPQFGVLWKQLMFYATAPRYGFRRSAYILVALAPLVGLSCLAILGMFLLQGTNWVALLILCAAMNGSGAVGDILMVALVLRYPRTAYIVDERDGFRVFTLPEQN
jgi:Putative zincin peptidase